jgi:hypothetical protein
MNQVERTKAPRARVEGGAVFIQRLLFGFIALWPLATIRESLWIDELHSAWVVQGPWSEWIERAAIGNQSPVYFAPLKLWHDVWVGGLAAVGWPRPLAAELSLRSFSWLSWCFLLGWIYRSTSSRAWLGLPLCLWLVFDRIGIFYANEVRPYLWVMIFVWLILQSDRRLADQPRRVGIGWIVASLLAFYTHYTAIVPVTVSWLIRTGLSLRNAKHRLSLGGARALELFLVTLVGLPGLLQLAAISGRSPQWSSFAGDTSLHTIGQVVPWLAWLLIPLVARWIEGWWCQRRLWLPGPTAAGRQPLRPTAASSVDNLPSLPAGHDPSAANHWRLAAVLAMGTLGAAWLLAAAGIAPLMHQRYLSGAYIACLAGGSGLIASLRRWPLVGLTLLVSLAALGWSQGTLGEWYRGHVLSWQRQEDWRALSATIAAAEAEGDLTSELIFLAPMLIETAGARLPSDLPEEYLVCPLRTLYQPPGNPCVVPLPNEPRSWEQLIEARLSESGGDGLWIVERRWRPAIDEVLAERRKRSEASASWQMARRWSFGRLQLAYVRLR